MKAPVLSLCVLSVATVAGAEDGWPSLSEAFGTGTPGAGGVAGGRDLFRVDIPTEAYPDALCADGSPGVFFVRAASEPAHQHDWVIYLQGGGSCNSGEQCHDRWLGRDGNFGANKLSSTFAPPRGMNGGGIENPDPRNPFAGWNHVFGYYCSSDAWSGQAKAKAVTTEVDGEAVTYQIHLMGAAIVDATVDMLRSGVDYLDAEDQTIAMPDLDEARRVLFAGSSAGGSGVRNNADRLGVLLQENNVRCDEEGCDLTFAAVIDASFGLGPEGLDHTDSRVCGDELVGECTYEQSMHYRWYDVVEDFRNARTDETCIDFHAPLADEWRCADGVHLLQHHIGSPFFVRTDLQDRLVMGNTLEAGYGYDGVPLNRALYGELEEIQLLEVANIAETSEEPREPSPLEPPGVFGPQCGDHETLRSDRPTYGSAVITEDGRRYTTLRVLWNWLHGTGRSIVVESFDPSGPPVSCRRERRTSR